MLDFTSVSLKLNDMNEIVYVGHPHDDDESGQHSGQTVTSSAVSSLDIAAETIATATDGEQ